MIWIEHVLLSLLKPSLSHIARYAPSLSLQKGQKIHVKIAQIILLPLLSFVFIRAKMRVFAFASIIAIF